MSIALIFEYAKHFFLSCVDFLSMPHGVVLLGVFITMLIVHLFEDMRS